MKCVFASALLLAGLALSAVPAGAQDAAKPPVAAKRPHEVKAPFGAVRVDDYYWLRDDKREDPAMLEYLKAENSYADSLLAPIKPLEDKLFDEIVSHVKQDDSSVPYLHKGYYYYSRFETGADYPVLARRKGSMDAPEQVLLDQPVLAKGHDFFAIGDHVVSPDDRLLAYTEDTVGRRQYVLKVRDLATGEQFADVIPNIQSDFAWAGDSRTIFYIERDPTTLLGNKVKAHVLGTPASADRLIYEEKDDTFYMGILPTSSGKYVCIVSHSTVSDEQRCAPVSDPTDWTVLEPRRRDHLYFADHAAGRWVIRTNWQAPNYRLMTVSEADAAKGSAAWADLVPVSDAVFIEDFKPFESFLAIEERAEGNKRIRLLQPSGKSDFVRSDEPAYAMTLDVNKETGTPWVRYTYDSLTTPQTTYEANVLTGERRVLKVQPVPGYDQSRYATERIWTTARDGIRVPVSLVYAKGFERNGNAPLLLYGYGSYGYSMDPAFSTMFPSLLDRGFVYAIAHVRGGQEMGRKWFDEGKVLTKKNSFTDFIDVTRDLVARRYAASGRVVAMGGSAGGLLVGAVMNMAPKDYGAVIALVPFVDVVTTMLDDSIPLTTGEYDEWGNPNEKQYYDYMLSYSPYDNVTAQAYPALFVGTGLWDSQVQYYEPAKWVAKLRATNTGNAPLVFRINMEAGHGGKSGRFQRYRERAEYLAFALSQVGVER